MSGGPAGRPARPRHRQGQGARPRPVDRLIPGWLGANDAPITDRRAPLALLGLGIGYLAGEDIAFPLTMALYFAFGALGGLWIPPSAMPHVIQDIGQALPSKDPELGWRIAGGQASAPEAILVLTSWTLGNATAALLVYRRRDTRSPARRQPPRAHLSCTKERTQSDVFTQ